MFAHAQAPAPPTTNTTATAVPQAKQVRVIADDSETRTAFANFADSQLNQFRALMKERDDAWSFPIELRVSGNANDVVEGATAAIPRQIELLPDGRINLQLYVRLHNRYDQAEVNRRFLQLLLYEMMTRQFAGQPNAFDEINLQVPYWLIRGLDELIQHRAAGRPSTLFAGIINSREVLPIDQILSRRENETLDPVSDAVFGASAAALVQALLDLEDGADSLRAYLASLPNRRKEGTDVDPQAELRGHFPGLRGSADALEKWWSIQIASMGELQAFEFYPPDKTEILLDQALAIDLPAEKVEKGNGIRKFLPHTKPREAFQGRVHDFEKFLDHDQAKAALEQSRLALKTLGLRAFPTYRGIVLRYELAVIDLINGKERGVAGQLEKLDQERAGVGKAMERVYDYMNYFEATQAEGGSEAYEHYRAMKEKLDQQHRPPRKDRISRYLDKLELEFEGQ